MPKVRHRTKFILIYIFYFAMNCCVVYVYDQFSKSCLKQYRLYVQKTRDSTTTTTKDEAESEAEEEEEESEWCGQT